MQKEGEAKSIMTMLPNPDSEAMGWLVDQWLVSLRAAGMSSRQLERYARALAAYHCGSTTPFACHAHQLFDSFALRHIMMATN